MTIDGYSALGQMLQGTWSLRLSNSCTVFQVIVQGGEQTILAAVVSSAEDMKGKSHTKQMDSF